MRRAGRVTIRAASVLLLLLAAAAPSRSDVAVPRIAEPDPEQSALALRRMMLSSMPSGWTVSEPQTVLDVPQITIGIPDSWRGSPMSVAIAHCPDADSPAWENPVLKGQTLLRLVVHYHNRDWPPYDCRP